MASEALAVVPLLEPAEPVELVVLGDQVQIPPTSLSPLVWCS